MSRHIVLIACAMLLSHHALHVQGAETSKLARLIVPYTPGGSSDLVARLVADKLGDQLKQRVVVENRPGAAGAVGTDLGAKAMPDGKTLLLAYTGTFSILPNLSPKIPYDPVRDFAPVTTVSTWTYLLVVHPSLPVKSITELIKLAASRPGELNYGSPGSGSVPHFAGARFQSMAKVNLVHVPYKGGNPAMMDLLAGQLHMYFASGPIALPHIKTSKLRLLAATSLKRSKLYPDVPTISELGLTGYDITAWYGIVVPVKTPKEVVDTTHEAIVNVVKNPDYAPKLATHGIEPMHTSPGEFLTLIKNESQLYARIIKEGNIKAD